MRVFAFRAGVILAQSIQKHIFPIRAHESRSCLNVIYFKGAIHSDNTGTI